MNLAQRLPQIWYGNAPAPLWLRALVPIYGALRALHRGAYASGWRRQQALPVPVIVVGNITVGGTGKTPLVIALVEALRARGRRPGVISRGYGGRGAAPMLVDAHGDAARCGDEPLLIRNATDAPVAIGSDRIAAAKLLLAANACDILIADDGLQHYPLLRNVEICVIDGERRFGNGRLLPAGPLREPQSRLASISFRVCNGGQAQAGEIPMHLVGDSAVSLQDASNRKPLADFAGRRVHAVAGIGNPARFFSTLRNAGMQVIEHPFPDHHAFMLADLSFGDGLPIVMTEKDAVKCVAFALQDAWQVPVHAQLPAHFFDALFAQLDSGRVDPVHLQQPSNNRS